MVTLTFPADILSNTIWLTFRSRNSKTFLSRLIADPSDGIETTHHWQDQDRTDSALTLN